MEGAVGTRSQLVLGAVLAVVRPLARLLLRHGVAYPAFAAGLKRVFLEAAVQELASRQMPATDSALSLLSGVHRRDIRTMTRSPDPAARTDRKQFSVASEAFARWISDPVYSSGRIRKPRALPRTGPAPSFESLAESVSRDVRPRALLDELVRLGIAEEREDGVRLLIDGFVPQQGFEELSMLFRDNLHDHLAAAAANLSGDANFLEQSLFVDQLTEESAEVIHRAAARAWRAAFGAVMVQARARFDQDALLADASLRNRRVRFGAFFFTAPERDVKAAPAARRRSR